MTLLSKFNVFEKDGVGYFIVKRSRFNFVKRLRRTHIELYYVPAFDGAKPHLIESPDIALAVSQAADAWQAMSILRASKSS